MDTEIELKFLVFQPDIKQVITQTLQQRAIPFTEQQTHLINCYYDTADFRLQRAKMALRVRTVNGKSQQTIKTQGEAVGGLHQRPEYNIAIEDTIPNLSLFPDTLWQQNNLDVQEIQQAITPLFNTDFQRHTWTLSYQDSVIELAYDVGTIATSTASVAINEVELELLKGHRDDLLSLARLLMQHVIMIPGVDSKAARGYQLLSNYQLTVDVNQLELIQLNREQTLEQAFKQGLTFALKQLQHYVVAYLEEPRLRLLIKITEMLALMRHGFWLFDSLLPENKLPLRQQISDILKQFDWVDSARHFKELTDKTGNYRKKLEYSEQLVAQLKFERNQFPNPDDVKQVLLSSRFNLMQLDLLELLLSSKIFQDTEESLISLPRFAQQQLSANLAELKQVLLQSEPLSAQQYLSQYQLLIRSLLTGSWFGALFDQDERDDYRDQWLDIKQGIAELQTLMIAKTHLDEVERTDEQAVAAIEKLQPWLDNKVDNLLIALEHSRQMARSIEPYWE